MRRNRKNRIEESDTSAGWLTTYSDLVTLLLTFFVMLFSMANVDKAKFEAIALSFQSAFLNVNAEQSITSNKGKQLISITQHTDSLIPGESRKNEETEKVLSTITSISNKKLQELNIKKLENVKNEIEKAIEKYNLKDNVTIIDQKQTLILRFDSVMLFDLGSADIKESSQSVLKELGAMFKELDNYITIKGHTDDLPINTALFPSNWELSTKRATNVVTFLIENCELAPNKLTAAGKGEFEPIMPNDTKEHRQKNRRIDIEVDKYIIE